MPYYGDGVVQRCVHDVCEGRFEDERLHWVTFRIEKLYEASGNSEILHKSHENNYQIPYHNADW